MVLAEVPEFVISLISTLEFSENCVKTELPESSTRFAACA